MSERVWIPDESMRLVRAGDQRLCRMKGCNKPAAVEFRRTHWQRSGPTLHWWAYCSEHTYGRRIADGKVWIDVSADSPLAERASEHRADLPT